MNTRVLIVFLFGLVMTAYATSAREGAVEVELVSEVASIQAGQPFMVALRVKHDPHWHTYWKNAGTGYPTSITWNLPAGFTVGEIGWPVPQVFADAEGNTTGYGYEGEQLLRVKITPPAALTQESDTLIRARVEWLMCKEVCMPGEAHLQLEIPVGSGEPRPSQWADRIKAATQSLPSSLPSRWKATATRVEGFIELKLQVTGDVRPPATTLQFLSEDGLIDYSAPQVIKVTKEGYVFRLKVAEDAGLKRGRLAGVIVAEHGWTGEAQMRAGMQVDLPIK